MVRIAVVIPCFRVRTQILGVLAGIGPKVTHIYVVDDACPESTGAHVAEHCGDGRVRVLHQPVNGGVGAATIAGYLAALRDQCDVDVKMDGDGQMDPSIVHRFVAPILDGWADYTKGNRSYSFENSTGMPVIRRLGNLTLSFMAKASTGYWDLFDPTNGYTAIHSEILRILPLEKVEKRYFFESDLLFRLNTLKAQVVDIPKQAVYGDEQSGLSVAKSVPDFAAKHLRNFAKRICYNYFLRDLNPASVQLVAGLALVLFGSIFGIARWVHSIEAGVQATAGTVMLAALPLMIGVQFLLSFVLYDVAASQPSHPLVRRMTKI